nr:hemicentin-2 [Halyomorpha halys]
MPLATVALSYLAPTVSAVHTERDPPEVRLVGAPTGDIEENKDDVVLQCITDANPPASVVWRKSGRTDIASLEDRLQFRPVTRRDSGTYTCQARNSMGSSEPLTVHLEVKFGPTIRSVGPDRLSTANLYGEAKFDCEAEANPTPTYQWLQQVPELELPLIVSNEAKLELRNVSYQHQGDYICRVWNYIGNTERAVMSDPVTLQVVGGPQVLRGSWGGEVTALRGEDATLGLLVCADPRPRHATWEWGSLHLQVGQGLGRFQAEQLVQQEKREDCYEARLHVRQVDPTDSRTYFLKVENDKGTDRHYLRLAVRGSYNNEPLTMLAVVCLAGICLAIFLVCVICGVYCARTEKCCFSRRNDFQPADLESEKSDMESSLGRKNGSERCLTRPGEALYRAHNISAPSPEAMKVRLAAMVLQPPTRSEHKKRKRRQRKDPELYGDGELPTVSSRNETSVNRMNFYTRAFPDYGQPTYFCPPQGSRTYERTLRASSFYQPNSIDKAEI